VSAAQALPTATTPASMNAGKRAIGAPSQTRSRRSLLVYA
jgi:hypothetical protein